MKSSYEKSGSGEKLHKKSRGRAIRPSKMLFVAAALSAALALAVFVFVSSRGRVPAMPRAVFSAQEETEAIKDLEERVRGFTPTQEELELIAKLEDMHALETSEGGLDNPKEIRKKIEAFQAVATRFSGTAEERYLLLGDYLAFEFTKAMQDVLKELRIWSENKDRQKGDVSLERVKKLGGSFFNRCATRGAITHDGRLLASALAPEVLFRARWRVLGDLRLEQGLGEAEKKAYYDFVVAFSSPQAVSQRLGAARELGQLDKSFDADIAKALILYQNGDVLNARKQLKAALDAGRGNTAIRNFLKALKPQRAG